MSSQDSSKSLKLLSLDGGGVRGLASLLILDNLMRRINPDNPPKPCEFFDLIGGTSTGGLIAIMLGPLEMDVQSCINAYVELSERVFVHKKSSWRLFSKALDRYRMKERFDSAKLEEAIVKIIEAQGKSKDVMIFDEKNPYPKCKAFVCVTLKSNAQNTCFRSYNSPRGVKSNCKLWEACRATSAASGFFDPISIGKLGEYVDGATGRNNPVNQVLEEARDIWPDADQRIQCFISLGTGQPGFQKYGNNLIEVVKTLKSIATETERTAEAFLKAHPELRRQNRYFRFNVTKGLEAIGLDESKKMAEMSQATHVYLESEGVRVEMEECVKSLRASSFSIIRRPRQDQTIFKTNEDFAEKYESIRSWLSPPAYDYDYPRIKAQREPKTCKWIFERDQLRGWIDGSSRFLWIHGKPGCGKSVIASTIVETVEIEYCKSIDPWKKHLGYVFCDKTDASKRNFLAVMKILVWQIISREDLQPSQKQVVLAAWRATSDTKSLSKYAPNSTEDGHFHRLFELYKQLVAVYATYSVILDGLDECENPESLLRLFLDLLAASPHVRLLFVSQNVNCVSSIILPLDENRPTIEITPSDNHGDISSYVDTHLPRVLKLGTSLHSKVRSVLLEKAQGMFLWVRLAMSQLETAAKAIRVTESRLLEVVGAFPKKLDDLYIYILGRILRDDEEGLEEDNAARRQDVCRVLEIVLWSFRPLKIEELQFAIEPNADETAIRQISEEESLADFKAKISSLCAPLLLFQENNTVTVIHSTFKIFMESKVGNYPTFKDLFQPEMVHCRIAAACIRYLKSEVFGDFIWFNRPHDRTIDELFVFKSYATQYWWLHLGQFSPGDGDKYQEMSEQLEDFLISDQAITWIESYFNMYNSSTSFRYIYLGLKSNLQGWVVPLGMDEWDIRLFQRSITSRTMQESEDDSKINIAINRLLGVCGFNGQVKRAQSFIVQFLSTKGSLRGDSFPDKSTLKLMGILAGIYIDQNLWEEAEHILLQVVNARERSLGKENPATLMALETLAMVYHKLGQFLASEKLRRPLLNTRKRVLSEEHPDTLRAMEDLARTYHELDLSVQAEELRRSLLDIRKRLLGDEDPDTLRAMEDLARTYYKLDLFVQAEELDRSLLDIRKRLLGDEHPDTLRAMENLAGTYYKLDLFVQAEEVDRSLLDIRRRLLGDEHPDTLKTLETLCNTYHHLGKSAEKVKFGRLLVILRRRLLGEEHPDTLSAMENLGLIYHDLGRFAKSEELKLLVLEARKRLLGIGHPETLRALESLVGTCQAAKRFPEAKRLIPEALATLKKLPADRHLEIARAVVNLGITYSMLGQLTDVRDLLEEQLDTLDVMTDRAIKYASQGQLKEATELASKVLDVKKELFGEEHQEALKSMHTLAKMYFQYRWEKAEALLKQVVGTRKRLLGEEDPSAVEATYDLATTYFWQDKWEEAAELYVEVVESRKKIQGEEHSDTVEAMYYLAAIRFWQSRSDEATELYTKVMNSRNKLLGDGYQSTLPSMASLAVTSHIQVHRRAAARRLVEVVSRKTKLLGEEHPETLWAIHTLARRYFGYRWDMAGKLLRRVVDARKGMLGEEHPSTMEALDDLATTEFQQENWEEAADLYKRVVDARERILGENHLDTVQAMADLAATCFRQEKWDESADLYVKVMNTKKLQDEGSVARALLMRALVGKCVRQESWEKVQKLCIQILENTKGFSIEEHPYRLHTIIDLNNLAVIYRKQNRVEEAEKLELEIKKHREISSGEVLGWRV